MAPPTAEGAKLALGDVLDSAPLGAGHLQVLGLCLATSILDGVDTMVMSFLAPAASHDLGASHGAFGLVFSGTLLGGALGATVLGALADRFGRKLLVTLATLWFGLFTLACAAAPDLKALIALRVIAGFGLGGAIPNILALAGEYAPARVRSRAVSIVTWGTPLGAVVGGLASPPMIEAWGWRSVLVACGVAPLLLVPLLVAGLPESARFLALRNAAPERVRKAMRKVLPNLPADVRFGPPPAHARPRTRGLAAVFDEGRAPGAILLALTMFSSLILSFFLVNWSPTLLTQAGLPLRDAIVGTVLLNLGGVVGSLLIARVADRRANRPALLAVTYGLATAAVLVAAIVTRPRHMEPALALLALATCGFFLIGSQIVMSALITEFFPTAIRGAGVGFNNAFARFGSLLGPALGGLLLGLGVSPAGVLAAGAAPGLASVAALTVLAALQARGDRRRAAPAEHFAPPQRRKETIDDLA
jgi:AAHS family 4-hydroxybenzoate transporter-like MFS transporter